MTEKQLKDLRLRVINILDELKEKNTVRAFDGLYDLLNVLDFHLMKEVSND